METLQSFDAAGAQAARDADLRRRHFTGTEFDLVTRDYAIWLDGRVVGFAPSPEAGQRLLSRVD